MIQRFATILNCEMMKTQFKYLRLLAGGVTKESSSRREWWKE